MQEPVDNELSILCWEGYDLDPILAPFRERTGARTRARTLISDAHTAHALAEGSLGRWDVLNINNAYVRDYLDPRALIASLDESRFGPHDDFLLPGLERHFDWRFADDGRRLGICQRFGTFNLVVNTRRIAQATAEDMGFALADDPTLTGRFGILDYDDFNIFHLCIGSGLDPFESLTPAQKDAYESTARRWYRNAAIASTDHHRLNRLLADGSIDFYVSGGVYTVSPARLEGHFNLKAITPRHGPIAGRGAIAFVEITSILNHAHGSFLDEPSPVNTGLAEEFLAYLLEPETAARAAFVDGTCNPVAQMGDARVMRAFTSRQLRAIQWHSLHEDMERCVTYRLVPDHQDLLAGLRAARRGAGAAGC